MQTTFYLTFRLTMIGAVVATMSVAGCSTPPRGRGPSTDPSASEQTSQRPADDANYDFEKEQPAPEAPGDVAFEEDQLPPRPEDMNSSKLAEDPVVSDPLHEPMDLPEPAGAQAGARAGAQAGVVTPVQPTVTTPVPQGRSGSVVRGFRVQLLAVTEQAKAQMLAQEASQRLGIPVHVVLEAPHYKVRAGDYLDRADAVRLKERAASLGYDEAWVVTDQVEVQK